jgi:hypothetical protein
LQCTSSGTPFFSTRVWGFWVVSRLYCLHALRNIPVNQCTAHQEHGWLAVTNIATRADCWTIWGLFGWFKLMMVFSCFQYIAVHHCLRLLHTGCACGMMNVGHASCLELIQARDGTYNEGQPDRLPWSATSCMLHAAISSSGAQAHITRFPC